MQFPYGPFLQYEVVWDKTFRNTASNTKRRGKDFVGMAAEKKSFKDSTFFSLHGMLEFYLLHLNTLNAPPLFSIPGGTNSITFEGTFMNKSTKESALQLSVNSIFSRRFSIDNKNQARYRNGAAESVSTCAI